MKRRGLFLNARCDDVTRSGSARTCWKSAVIVKNCTLLSILRRLLDFASISAIAKNREILEGLHNLKVNHKRCFRLFKQQQQPNKRTNRAYNTPKNKKRETFPLNQMVQCNNISHRSTFPLSRLLSVIADDLICCPSGHVLALGFWRLNRIQKYYKTNRKTHSSSLSRSTECGYIIRYWFQSVDPLSHLGKNSTHIHAIRIHTDHCEGL